MYTAGDGRSGASKFGQLIGEAFEQVVWSFIQSYLEESYPEYEMMEAKDGAKRVTLDMLGGSARQMDTIIAAKGSDDPVVLLESKWLKDARHHNDKGAWILQLREVGKQYPSIRGAAAVLAGYWTEGVGIMLLQEGGVEAVLVATDEEVYGTLQPHLDAFLGNDTFIMDAKEMRKSYPRPWDLANCLIDLQNRDLLPLVANSWLDFERSETETGRDRIREALDGLLAPLPEALPVKKYEIGLRIATGNMIFEAFDDLEDLMTFLQTYHQNSDAIRERITPKPRKTSDEE